MIMSLTRESQDSSLTDTYDSECQREDLGYYGNRSIDRSRGSHRCQRE